MFVSLFKLKTFQYKYICVLSEVTKDTYLHILPILTNLFHIYLQSKLYSIPQKYRRNLRDNTIRLGLD